VRRYGFAVVVVVVVAVTLVLGLTAGVSAAAVAIGVAVVLHLLAHLWFTSRGPNAPPKGVYRENEREVHRDVRKHRRTYLSRLAGRGS
jgi:hypothetical protein